MIEYLFWGCLGTLYGTLIGIIPIAGVTTALITIFSVGSYFLADPYVGLVFLMSIVASCAAADSYTSILTGIPGASSTAACVLDGYPMCKNGEAPRAMGIAVTDSFFNGMFFTLITFALLPWYGQIILYIGTPEFAGLMLLSMATVFYISKSLLAISVGLFLGLIGLDPATGTERFTFGWDYLEAGIQIIPIMAGLFGVPELVYGWKTRVSISQQQHYFSGFKQGVLDVWRYRIDVFRGGCIGFVSGLLPGVGGAVGDFLAYGATKAARPHEPYGTGTPVGLAGCEGANSAQKVSSMIPTMLFGIPAAPFAAMVMAICMYFGIELGTPDLLYDDRFIESMALGYLIGTLGVALLSVFLFRYIVKILEVPFWVYATAILAVIVYANMQYTGGWEDLVVLIGMSVIGIVCKHFDINRPAILIMFVIAERLENYVQQTHKLYSLEELMQRPLIWGITLGCGLILYSALKKAK